MKTLTHRGWLGICPVYLIPGAMLCAVPRREWMWPLAALSILLVGRHLADERSLLWGVRKLDTPVTVELL